MNLRVLVLSLLYSIFSFSLALPSCYGQERQSLLVHERYLNPNSLLERLSNPSDAVRARACFFLGQKGILAKDSKNSLQNLLRTDSSKWVRRASLKALVKIKGREARSDLEFALKDKDFWVRSSALKLLEELGFRARTQTATSAKKPESISFRAVGNRIERSF